jgi:AmmeMemoRadiSam system protein B/AmmeMemoRadiSam system protein A
MRQRPPRFARPCVWLAVLSLTLLPLACAGASDRPGERPAAVAGQFYPADPAKLEAAVRAFLHDAVPARGERPLAIVVPHAGYVFSGQIAADAFNQARGRDYDLVVILGTNHTTASFDGVSIYPAAGYRTPLGLAEIDEKAAAELAAQDPAFTFRPDVHRREHSVEVQVPFVQIAFPGVKILPMVVGGSDPELCARLGRALAEVVRDRHALIVASSDLSHYPAYEDAVIADRATLTAMATLDPEAVRAAIGRRMADASPGLVTCACGEGPVLAALETARALGATRGAVISYANSGDTPLGDRGRVVGYGAVVFSREPGPPDLSGLDRPQAAPAKTEVSEAEGRALLAFARETIRRYLATETVPLARGFSPTLNRKQGVFVTLTEHGELRGCIGHTIADLPLGQAVGAMALQAALNDRRFTPLRPDELDDLDIEVSLLTPFAAISGPEKIVLGRDGVLLKKDGRSAIFLPEVAVEQGWTRDEVLRHLCLKAGLPADAWRSGAELSTFQSRVFHESDGR